MALRAVDGAGLSLITAEAPYVLFMNPLGELALLRGQGQTPDLLESMFPPSKTQEAPKDF